jgi:protein-S-isoprenylcysteine O-methyltransferase
LWQWCAYFTCLCSFHLLEFFVTAIYNPSQVTADSFLVNHSITYTAAALTSWIEFGLRLAWFPRWNGSSTVILLGLSLVLGAQAIRSTAMATAGESFNHLIQTSKKDNHVLVTHGIYSVLRHPSYVGFFYWSIGTQILLGNVLHTMLFAVAAWLFFHRRIAYEEESLCRFFPDAYPLYVARTYMGIPFLRTQVDTSQVAEASGKVHQRNVQTTGIVESARRF